MKAILNHLFEHKNLQRDQAKSILKQMASGTVNPAQIASFLTVFIMRGITVEELEGFRDAMLDLCIHIDLSEFDPIDLCGTGGDGKNTFNVSTIASFIVAGAGVKVAKHGNYGVSSISGSSNVIQYMGHEFTNDPDQIRRSIDQTGICFLHAPLFHPAMKHVAPIRKEMGVKTFFNMLGPMVNPAFVKKQLVGVFSLELARLYAYLYQQSDKQFSIVHSLDGYDEISLTSSFKRINREEESLLEPEKLGFMRLQQSDLYGGTTIKEAADLFQKILKGEGNAAQNSVVLANAALAIETAKACSWDTALGEAKESLSSGKAYQTLQHFLA